MGLRAAKELIASREHDPALFDGRDLPPAPHAPGQGDVQLPCGVIEALARGDRLTAIKELRLARRLGLKEAKDEVERLLERDPKLRRSFDLSLKAEPSGSAGWILARLAGLAIGCVAVRLTFQFSTRARFASSR